MLMVEHFYQSKTDNIFEHNMHSEFGNISEQSASTINKNRKKGGRIIAVGTTVLEVIRIIKR